MTGRSFQRSAFVLIAVGLGLALAQTEDDGRTLSSKLSLEEIVEYKAFTTYQEAPELTALVEAGKLPPVSERLPEEPRVLKSAGMVDGPGVYGGVWRDSFGVPVVSWNWGAGQTQGWYGVNELVQEALVDLFPMWMMEEPEPAPRLAKSWEWSEDGMSLTMELIEGAKWSDGTPFTADDVVFTYENYILDPQVPSWLGQGSWTYGGKVTTLEKLDDYTIRFNFGAPYPFAAFYNMGYLNFSIMPKHVFSKFHPEFNEGAAYQELLTSAPPQDLPPVTMGAFVPVRYKPGEQLILVRNPYYWQVDEEGKQLPYISEVRYAEVSDNNQRTFNLINNSGDRDNVENPQIFAQVFQASQEPDSHFNLSFEGFSMGFRLLLNFSEYGATTPRQKALRTLFHDLKFREALSYAVDRQGLATAAFAGPLTRPWYGGYPSGSPYFEESLVKAYEYDPDQARALLGELGFIDSDDDGLVNWPQGGPMAGQNLLIEIITSEDVQSAVEAGQALVPMLREVGIDIRFRVVPSAVLANLENASNFDMQVERLTNPAPDIHMGDYGPSSVDDPFWHQGGPGGQRSLLPFEEEMASLMQEARFTTDPARRGEIFRELLRLSTENVYTIGLYEARRGIAVNKRLKNIPDDLPTYQYEWGMENMPWLAWTPTEEQITPRFLELIPTAEDYQDRAWN
jgi:peptide/nickel transport system substrate-binding protein